MSDGDAPGPFARFRAWLSGLFGGSEAGGATDEAAAPEPTHVCNVCGTDVAEPSGGCPLCGSTDLREQGAPAPGSEGPAPEATSSASTVDDEVSRLREMQGEGDEGGD
jgi:hypothetical protein